MAKLLCIVALLLCFSAVIGNALLIPPTRPVASYSEITAQQMMLLSGSAYATPPGICDPKYEATKNFLVTHRFSSSYKGIPLAGLAGVNFIKRRITLVFKGTGSAQQLIHEFTQFNGVTFNSQYPNVKVNSYFRAAQLSMFTQAKAALLDLQQKYPTYQLYMSGHSLGGAIATIMAFDFYTQNLLIRNDPVLYSFGQPRAGNYEFAKQFDKFIPTAYRIVNGRDVVAHVPPCNTALFRRGCITGSKQNNYHHGIEIWYKDGMPSVNPNAYIESVMAEEETEVNPAVEEKFNEGVQNEEQEIELQGNPDEIALEPETELENESELDEPLEPESSDDELLNESELENGVTPQFETQKEQDEEFTMDVTTTFNGVITRKTTTDRSINLHFTIQSNSDSAANEQFDGELEQLAAETLDEDGAEISSYQQCAGDAQACSNTLLFKTSIDDHRRYFGMNVSEFCKGVWNQKA